METKHAAFQSPLITHHVFFIPFILPILVNVLLVNTQLAARPSSC